MPASAADLRVDPTRAGLLVVDVQERLATVMPDEERAALERNVGVLLELARRAGMPVVVSEQYPKGLGPTVPALAAGLAALGPAVRRMEKMEFAVTSAPGWDELARELGREQWIVVGMETHVCVFQTVRGLAERGAAVHVPADAVVSRTLRNRDIGLGLMAKAGALVSSTEVIVFDVLQKAGGDDFRALSRMIR